MGFYIQDDYWEALEDLPKKQQDEVLGALSRLFFKGEDKPPLKGASKALFIAFRDRVLLSKKRSDSGKSPSGKSTIEPGSNSRSNGDQNAIKPAIKRESNADQNSDQNAIKSGGDLLKREREKDKANALSNPLNPLLSIEEADAAFGAEALSEFNRITGQSVQSLSPSAWTSLARIRASGRTIRDVTLVVQSKLEEWGGDSKMSHYVRPSTLFGQKFEEYLGAAKAAEERRGVNRFAEYD